MCWRAKQTCFNVLDGDVEKQYSQLQSFGYALLVANEASAFNLEQDDGRFTRMFVSLRHAKLWFSKSAKIVSLDGTNMRSKYGGTMLIAVTLDPNDQLVMLAFAILAGNEDRSGWTYFLSHLTAHIPEMITTGNDLVVISDRDKGLLPSVLQILPQARHSYCLRHICDNARARRCGFNIGARQSLWKAAYATSQGDFDMAMSTLQAIAPQCAEYLRSILSAQWSTLHFPGRRYGHLTSNISESFNNMLRERSELCPFCKLQYRSSTRLCLKLMGVRTRASMDGPLLLRRNSANCFQSGEDATRLHLRLWNILCVLQVEEARSLIWKQDLHLFDVARA
eukprot:TRINITY_DN2353_c0_g1_i3.p1 TRINITY_DN2353_c0_g1~~TRINITY_DN2353_c0_g1_i3.p1  ORF type:complete len:337 (+),score=43.97 TRINITY_DN2353_c0_g1_i3:294-1304(+)